MKMRPGFTILFFFLLFAAACGDQGGKDNRSGPLSSNVPTTSIRWIDSARNYGKVIMGQKLAVAFRFRNTGKYPLVIQSVRPSCGCTVADFPKQPVAPGGEGEITGVFDSHGREGIQHKEITVRTNTAGGGEQQVSFDVTVVKKEGIPDTEEQ